MSALTAAERRNRFDSELRRAWLEERLGELEGAISTEETQLMPTAMKRLKVLRQLGYVSQADSLLVRGRVACEVCTVTVLLRCG